MLTASIALSLCALAACSSDIGRADTNENRVMATGDLSVLRNFTGVAANGTDDVVVTVGPAFHVVAQGNPRMLAQIELSVESGTLKIGRKQGLKNFLNNDKGATIRISMPTIDSAALTGSGKLRIDRAGGEALALSLTGSGDMTVGASKLDRLEADLTGSGGMRLVGTVNDTSLSANGRGNIDAAALNAGKGDISIMGSGDVDLHSDGIVRVHIMGSGNANVRGKAKCTIAAMGSGKAHCAS